MEQFRLGGNYLGHDETSFCVWAPNARQVDVAITTPDERVERMRQAHDGYFHLVLNGIKAGTRYLFVLNGKERRADPASRYQPEGVHGPSEIVESTFAWEDTAWCPTPLRDYIIYELHVGTFTPEGTFEAIIPHLGRLRDLGITAIELMPVAQFPGKRNWGYDGVYPFAVQDSYGGPIGLKRLVNACHQHGLSVILDVVYNHFGIAVKRFARLFPQPHQGASAEGGIVVLIAQIEAQPGKCAGRALGFLDVLAIVGHAVRLLHQVHELGANISFAPFARTTLQPYDVEIVNVIQHGQR